MQTTQPATASVYKPDESAQATEDRAKSFKTVDNYDEAIRHIVALKMGMSERTEFLRKKLGNSFLVFIF